MVVSRWLAFLLLPEYMLLVLLLFSEADSAITGETLDKTPSRKAEGHQGSNNINKSNQSPFGYLGTGN